MEKNLLKSMLLVIVFLASQVSTRAQCGAVAIPVYEDFEGLTADDQLPPCWAASDLGNACKTFSNSVMPYTGNASAAFFSGPGGNNYFFSQALTLKAGVTYSASVWKCPSKVMSSNWSFSLLLGTSQSTTGLVAITNPSAVTSPLYTQTGNIFSVASSGTYYVVIMANSAVAGATEYLYWDDFRVTVPCLYSGNSPTINITSTPSFVCAGSGSGSTLTASGADTYTWTNGANTNTIVYTPQFTWTASHLVAGTNTLTGCTTTANIPIVMKPGAIITVSTSAFYTCPGETFSITAKGADTFTWSTGQTGPVIQVSPQTPTFISVAGTNSNGCIGNFSMNLMVYPSPTLNITATETLICAKAPINLSANGASTYNWLTPTTVHTGSSLVVHPSIKTTYTVQGFSVHDCMSQKTIVIDVLDCVGAIENLNSTIVRVYPNPVQTTLIVEMLLNKYESITIFDYSGKLIFERDLDQSGVHLTIPVDHLPTGIYFVRLSGTEKNNLYKIRKE